VRIVLSAAEWVASDDEVVGVGARAGAGDGEPVGAELAGEGVGDGRGFAAGERADGIDETAAGFE